MARKNDDEQLEIVFWWTGGDSKHPIEDGLEGFLAETKLDRRRRLPWPERRHRSSRTA